MIAQVLEEAPEPIRDRDSLQDQDGINSVTCAAIRQAQDEG